MPRYGVHGPRYFALLSRVREAAPPEEWIHKAIEEVKETEMTFTQRIRMRLNGYVYVGHRIKPSWRRPKAFYMFKCPVHGHVEDYAHGYSQWLDCPECRKERTQR